MADLVCRFDKGPSHIVVADDPVFEWQSGLGRITHRSGNAGIRNDVELELGFHRRARSVGGNNPDLQDSFISSLRRSGETLAVECQPGRQGIAVGLGRRQGEKVARVDIYKRGCRNRQVEEAADLCFGPR